MRDYDEANRADDDRNSKMSDLAQENETMSRALHEIKEIWTGSEGFIPETCAEAYLEELCKKMFSEAAKALRNLP